MFVPVRGASDVSRTESHPTPLRQHVKLRASAQAPGFNVRADWTLRVEGRHFVDPAGRVVLLRGVNLAGDAKVPPFAPRVSERDLDRIAAQGFNVLRLVFIWEAYEPRPGQYDESYLTALANVAEAAWARGLYTILDVHQDGFSRFASRGFGDGFPRWAVSPRGRLSRPVEDADTHLWPIIMATDPTTHKSFEDFYADRFGVRTRYLKMIERLALRFRNVPGVIGYDPINEPWGDERKELLPLYQDVARIVRVLHPEAILFFEGRITTNSGLQSKLPRPDAGPTAYAPHYYNTTTLLFGHWHRLTPTVDNAFRHMTHRAETWNAPLFLGEFGMDVNVKGCGDYVDALYDRLDDHFASSAQWNVTPGWTPARKDGWNGEDFNMIGPDGRPRKNFRPRPYPRATAGRPLDFRFERGDHQSEVHTFAFSWRHVPGRGPTEIFVPASLFPPGSIVRIASQPPSIHCLATWDRPRRRLLLRAGGAATFHLLVTSPALEPSSAQVGRLW